jgi:hypothetical protein
MEQSIMSENNVFAIGAFVVIAITISWFGFNIHANNTFDNEQQLKKLSLTADQICALQPITNQTEFCRDRINFFNKDNPVK